VFERRVLRESFELEREKEERSEKYFIIRNFMIHNPHQII
jgi:hypothetical protein